MDVDVVGRLRRVVSGTAWFEQARHLAAAVHANTVLPGGLIVVGAPPYTPDHLVSHLRQIAHATKRPELSPRLHADRVHADRVHAHRAGWDDVAQAGGGECVLVVAPGPLHAEAAEVVAAARAREALIGSIDAGDPWLTRLSDLRLVIGRPTTRPSEREVALARASGKPLEDRDPVEALPVDVAEHLLASMLLHHGDRPGLAHRVASGLGRRVAVAAF